ncbi:MAG: hypothetical protein R3F61_15545 [Myxococcota bacterium]
MWAEAQEQLANETAAFSLSQDDLRHAWWLAHIPMQDPLLKSDAFPGHRLVYIMHSDTAVRWAHPQFIALKQSGQPVECLAIGEPPPEGCKPLDPAWWQRFNAGVDPPRLGTVLHVDPEGAVFYALQTIPSRSEEQFQLVLDGMIMGLERRQNNTQLFNRRWRLYPHPR